jgi:hypothetical protein
VRRREGTVAAVVLWLAAVAGEVLAPARAVEGPAPRFEVDPFWPKPLPNRCLMGRAAGVTAVDSRRNIHTTEVDTGKRAQKFVYRGAGG